MSRIEYRFALALSLAVLVPHVLVAQQTSAAQQHFAAAPESLNSIAVDAQQPPTATQPPATQPPRRSLRNKPSRRNRQPALSRHNRQPALSRHSSQRWAANRGQLPRPNRRSIPKALPRSSIACRSILNAALGNRPADSQAVGTSGVLPGVDSKSKAGKVSVDRAALDEILAEVQQLRTMLRVRQQ